MNDQKAYASQTLNECTNHIVNSDNTKYTGTRLELANNIGIHVAFSGLTADMYAVVTHTDHRGNERKSTITLEGKNYFDIDQIVVADGRKLVTVTVYNADDTVYDTVTDSVESYVARNSQSQDDLYAMIMKFSDSAWAYLHDGETDSAQ